MIRLKVRYIEGESWVNGEHVGERGLRNSLLGRPHSSQWLSQDSLFNPETEVQNHHHQRHRM